MEDIEFKYLKNLSRQFPNINSCITEIINLQAILLMPKPTEHFISDIHGEFEQFDHVLRNGSGSVKNKIIDEFDGELSNDEVKRLATLIYYPEEKIELLLQDCESESEFYKKYLNYIIRIAKRVCSKYTRSKVRKQLPKDFAYIIEELITEKVEVVNKKEYYEGIIDSIIQIGVAKEFMISLCDVIQSMVVDHLHIVGDIYDRGAGAVQIMNLLENYHGIDIEWGNHDMIYLTAATGNYLGVTGAIRNCIKYHSIETLEDGYGINLMPLVMFCLKTYGNTNTDCFTVKSDEKNISAALLSKMHKAITIMDFKLKAAMIKRHPDFDLDDRLLLDKINYEDSTIIIDGIQYHLEDTDFPTVNKEDPYTLTPEELQTIDKLSKSFRLSEKLQEHAHFLLKKGGMYKIYDNNLIYHGCIPMNKDKTIKNIHICGQDLKGKDLLDFIDSQVRLAFYGKDAQERIAAQDVMCFSYLSKKSPLFGKSKFAIFESYFIKDPRAKVEIKDPYYSFVDDEEAVNHIFENFNLDKQHGHIVNGHIPVQTTKGEVPIKCNGKLLLIDGGFSKAYHKKTGISGYTLVYNSHGLKLIKHNRFTSKQDSIINEQDIYSDEIPVTVFESRRHIKDTDKGSELRDEIKMLMKLLNAYKTGIISETI